MTEITTSISNANDHVYRVFPADPRPGIRDQWEDDAWRHVPSLSIDCFRPESSDHRPRTRAKLVADHQGLYGIFKVQDCYVRSVHAGFQAPVYKDSCVEFFVQPKPDRGYFNFEFNCGGAVLASFITDPVRTTDGFKVWQPLTPEDGRRILTGPTLPPVVAPELTTSTTWSLAFQIPLDILAAHVGPLGVQKGEVWRANFYKCGDETSHPHWAAWRPVNELNFHLPRCFGYLRFG